MLLSVILFTACSASKKDTASPEMADSKYATDGTDMAGESTGFTTPSYSTNDSTEDSVNNDNKTDINQVTNDRKLIRRVTMFVETLEFTSTLELISNEVISLGGYVETSEINGNKIKDTGTRYAQLVLRIPSTKVDYFINLLDDNTNVTSKAESTKDVTLDYVDTESHIKTLKIEQERLLALLEKADKLEDIITLEDRLSNVRYELEKYAATLRSYDNLVEFSTITLSISEVIRITPQEDKGAWGRIGSGLKDTFYSISDGFVNFMVWFIVNLPYFILWGGIIFIGTLIALRINKKHQKK
jgi:hypothetical protein